MPKRKTLDFERNGDAKRFSKRLKILKGEQEKSPTNKKCTRPPCPRISQSQNLRRKAKTKKEQDEKNIAHTLDNTHNHKKDYQVESSSSTLQDSKSHCKHITKPCTRLRQYWLLKAEPESRLEKGVDIKFSIDDLAARTVPEPWDGIRNYAARNHLRSMKKGDFAFFYHSSCKVPAIVGIMEIVCEHSPDLSANDPNSPYYDPKENPADPKWSLVHVEFRQKLKCPITLKELKAWHIEKGHVLGNLQMLKLTRMSVSKVEESEWNFLISEMIKRGDEPQWLAHKSD
ncbi:Thymocyte nuclear protein 1 [Erysiphe necator]|uniref:Thymocyte nuclear protein 1 n=1 Tax=Uncinula necator TaxID=52586 RepID=A0A0B1NWE2_UNCNE|nr:Thymocyte nuclear protein 1 [Erysiphe necator]KHJ30273.1 putative at dna binding protein [Erysiphe necator]